MNDLPIYVKKMWFLSSNAGFLVLMQLLRSKCIHLAHKMKKLDFSKFSLRDQCAAPPPTLLTLDVNMATDFWSAGHTYDHMESQIQNPLDDLSISRSVASRPFAPDIIQKIIDFLKNPKGGTLLCQRNFCLRFF